MRLVVDLQACQTGSRYRGIGRYAMGLVSALAAALGPDDELLIALDLGDSASVRDVRAELRRRGVSATVVGYTYPMTAVTDSSPDVRALAGQLRSRFFVGLKPDELLIASLFESRTGFTTELDWSALGGISTVTIGYDLIPLIYAARYYLEEGFDAAWYQARLKDFIRFDRILAISHASKRDIVAQLAVAEDRVSIIDAGFEDTLAVNANAESERAALAALGLTRPFVLTVTNGDWRKNTMAALTAFAALPEPVRSAHDLVMTQVGKDITQALKYDYPALQAQVKILGHVSDTTLAALFRHCKVFYFPSLYEGFGLPVLEAMALGAPVLTSNGGSLADVVHDPLVLFDPASPSEGPSKLAQALSDDAYRERLRLGAREHALSFTWQRTAALAMQSLRACVPGGVDRAKGGVPTTTPWPADHDIQLMASVCRKLGPGAEDALWRGLQAIALGSRRRVLIDVSYLAEHNLHTGIQRVTRQFFKGLALLAQQTGGFSVEPFQWTPKGIQYARSYARAELGVAACEGNEDRVIVEPSDLVFMLDSSWAPHNRFDALHARVHACGGEVVWMVYDLIPLRHPETCDPGMPPAFGAWLEHAVRTADGFVCISNATRLDLEAYIDEVGAPSRRPWTAFVHLGSDLDPRAADAVSAKFDSLRTALGQRPYCAALGTLEPRKDYPTILAAFERLWAQGTDIALLIIGKQGWNVDALVQRIQQHPELDRRLFWAQGASDGDLRQLLRGSAALIQASVAEGFGLPLIEAASLGVPLIASDIPVFHEVVGEAATYFPTGDATRLADAVLGSTKRHRISPAVTSSLRTWSAATQLLAETLLPGYTGAKYDIPRVARTNVSG